jgi:hypothetical protein
MTTRNRRRITTKLARQGRVAGPQRLTLAQSRAVRERILAAHEWTADGVYVQAQATHPDEALAVLVLDARDSMAPWFWEAMGLGTPRERAAFLAEQRASGRGRVHVVAFPQAAAERFLRDDFWDDPAALATIDAGVPAGQYLVLVVAAGGTLAAARPIPALPGREVAH